MQDSPESANTVGPVGRTRLLLNALALSTAVTSLGICWVALAPEDFARLNVLIVTTFVALGKLVVLIPIWEHDARFSPFFLAGMVSLMDIVTAMFVVANLDLLYRLAWVGPRLAAIEENGRGVLRRRPWLRRLAVCGVALFVTFPLTGTGAVGGTIFGRLIGLRAPRILLGITVGALVGSFGLAFGADVLARSLADVRDEWWFTALGLGLVAAFVGFVVWQTMRVKPRA